MSVVYQNLEGMFPSCHWQLTDTVTGEHTINSTPKAEWDSLTLEGKLLEVKKAFMHPLAPDDQVQFES